MVHTKHTKQVAQAPPAPSTQTTSPNTHGRRNPSASSATLRCCQHTLPLGPCRRSLHSHSRHLLLVRRPLMVEMGGLMMGIRRWGLLLLLGARILMRGMRQLCQFRRHCVLAHLRKRGSRSFSLLLLPFDEVDSFLYISRISGDYDGPLSLLKLSIPTYK
jgi:hypothetical protein